MPRGWTESRGPDHLSVGKLLVFALVPVVVLLLAAEVVLRKSGAALSCPIPAYLNPWLWQCDPLLHFQMNRDLRVEGHPLNALGMRGALLNPSAKHRVIALGDSVTFGYINGPKFFVHDPYPHRLQELADRRGGPGTLSVLNAGVCGYNSYHGIMLLRTKLRNMPADLITVQYGWNDLLTTAAYSGSDAFREPASAVARAGEDLLLRTALYPFARRLRMELDLYMQRAASDAKDSKVTWKPMAQWSPNVPVPEYEHNLRRIVELGRSHGAVVWLMTSPDAFTTDDYKGRESDYASSAKAQLALLQLGGIHNFEELEDIHTRYNDAVRRIGAELGVPVVDTDGTFRAHASEHLFSDIDAIHPTDPGHEVEAEELYTRLLAAGILTRAPAP